jgi:hypothetical protein
MTQDKFEMAIIHVMEFKIHDFIQINENTQKDIILQDLGFFDEEYIDSSDPYYNKPFSPYNFHDKMNSIFKKYLKIIISVRHFDTGNLVQFKRLYTVPKSDNSVLFADFKDNNTFINYDYNLPYDPALTCMLDYYCKRNKNMTDEQQLQDPYFQKGKHILLAMNN